MEESVSAFWQTLETATDPALYKPERNTAVAVARLSYRKEPYYVLKEPASKTYIRLSEEDYALWWQMNGCKSTKELLYYCLKRYKRLPFGHLHHIIHELKHGGFLADQPTNIYEQITAQLETRNKESRGRRLIQGILHTEIPKHGLDPFFTRVYRWTRPLFSSPSKWATILLAIVGIILFAWLYGRHVYSMSSQGIIGILTLVAANLFVLIIHELAHGLATKHIGCELDRGGFLIYWALPALFVDTRDTWMAAKRDRIFVSWVGPYSGLVVGGITTIVLTAVAYFRPTVVSTLWATFLYQIAFIAYLSVIINLNPLLELDGYFMLMDWLEIPNLRSRAFDFWREQFWRKLKDSINTHHFWQDLRKTERILTFYGAIAFVYSLAALWLAFGFWRSRLQPLLREIWQVGLVGQTLIILVTAVILLPIGYYIGLFAWGRLKAALRWLAHRKLLARPSVLALLVGLPLLVGVPFIWSSLAPLPFGAFWQALFNGVLFLVVTMILIRIARQLTGSRFQWAIWALASAPVFLAISSFMNFHSIWYDLILVGASGSIMACGLIAWHLIHKRWINWQDRVVWAGMLFVGIATLAVQIQIGQRLGLSNLQMATITLGIIFTNLGLVLLAPLLLNFLRSRFALSWSLLFMAMALTPWLMLYPQWHISVLTIWLSAATLHYLKGSLTQFSRYKSDIEQAAAFSERERLINSYDHFIEAFLSSYELVFGGRQLAAIRAEIPRFDKRDPDLNVLDIAGQARHALQVAVAGLNELAGTTFTQKAGQAAYDSLPWLEEETLARHVLASMKWGVQLAEGFIHEHDHRVELIRQADFFAGLDPEGVENVTAVMKTITVRPDTQLTQAGHEATHFYLIDSGKVGVFHNGAQVATVYGGGYFGTNAIAGQGNYNFTYIALTQTTLLTIFKDDFDPLLRADTTLSQQVSSGVEERKLLKKMPLFKSLSPQELATVDARMQKIPVAANINIVRQGEHRSFLYIIVKGAVEFYVTEEGREKIVGQLGPGEHFGEYAVFTNTPYHAGCRTVMDSEILMLNESTFNQLILNCERMSHYVEQIGSGRLIATQRHSAIA